MAQLVFDDASGARVSARSIDDNGFMRVRDCPLTKEQVAPYLGREIPHYRELGLEAERIYQVYRPAEELRKKETINSVRGIPLLLDHAPVSAEDIQEDRLVGSLGDAVEWDGEYLRCNLNIIAKKAQDRINDKSMRELSLSYAYTPVLKSGQFKGKHYDIVMRDIRANHLALVEAGRAGSDVRVCDGLPLELKQMEDKAKLIDLLNSMLDAIKGGNAPAVQDADPEDQDQTEEAVFNNEDDGQDPEAPEGADINTDNSEEAEDSDEDTTADSDDDTAEDSDEDPAEDEDLAEDEDDEKFTKILEGLGLEATPEMLNTLKSLANSVQNKAADSDEDAAADSDEGLASDSARNFRRANKRARKTKRMAMDSSTYLRSIRTARNIGRKEGADAAIKRMRSLETAAAVCSPILGKVSPLAFDSANQIYQDAAIAAGMSPKNAKNVDAARGYVLAELKHSGVRSKTFAMDSRAQNSQSMDVVRSILDDIEG